MISTEITREDFYTIFLSKEAFPRLEDALKKPGALDEYHGTAFLTISLEEEHVKHTDIPPADYQVPVDFPYLDVWGLVRSPKSEDYQEVDARIKKYVGNNSERASFAIKYLLLIDNVFRMPGGCISSLKQDLESLL